MNIEITSSKSKEVIQPINCELSNNMKECIRSMAWSRQELETTATNVLGIPKNKFGRK